MEFQDIYDRLLQAGEQGGAGSKFVRMSRHYASGHWRHGAGKPALFSRPFNGGTVVDYGSKFGHLTPILLAAGAGHVINVDVDDEYLRDGERFIGRETGAAYVKSDDCYLDIESGSVDFVLMNEVISHVNPSLLYTCLGEVARILKPGGEVVVWDVNNLDDPEVRATLAEDYCRWEHGESTDLGSNYQAMRGRMIRKAFPGLSDEQVGYYARNTSGLHTDRLLTTVRRAVEGGPFVERPHRKGQLPVHPGYGTVMERGFHASEVVALLAEHGLRGEQLKDDGVAYVVRAARTGG